MNRGRRLNTGKDFDPVLKRIQTGLKRWSERGTQRGGERLESGSSKPSTCMLTRPEDTWTGVYRSTLSELLVLNIVIITAG